MFCGEFVSIWPFKKVLSTALRFQFICFIRNGRSQLKITVHQKGWMVNLAVRFPIPWCPKWPTTLCLMLRKASQLLFQNFPRANDPAGYACYKNYQKSAKINFHKNYNLCHLGTFPRILLTSHSWPTVEKKHPKIILRNDLHGISVSKRRHA